MRTININTTNFSQEYINLISNLIPYSYKTTFNNSSKETFGEFFGSSLNEKEETVKFSRNGYDYYSILNVDEITEYLSEYLPIHDSYEEYTFN
jgi:hypothetical protein